jgi:hypothetical protein
MWDPQRLTTLWASMACYRDSFTFTFLPYITFQLGLVLFVIQASSDSSASCCVENFAFWIKTKFNKMFWEELIAYEAHNNSSIVSCVFIVAVTFLPSRCLATIGGWTNWWQGFMKHAVGTGSGAMIDMPSFRKIRSGIQKLICGGRGGFTV